jgi:hypothetical protein
MRLLSRRADDRPASARAFLEELKELERGLAQGEEVEASLDVTPVDEEAPTEVMPADRPPRRSTRPAGRPWVHWAVLAGGLGLCLVAVALGLLWAGQRSRGRPSEPGPPPEAKTPPDFVALFDGTGLAEWREDSRGGWEVADGLLRARGPGERLLRSKAAHGDFELKLECRLSRGGDAGVLLRLGPGEFRRPGPIDGGLEVHLRDDPPPGSGFPRLCGGLIEVVPPAGPPRYRGHGSWNQFRILCRGDHVIVEHNDGRVVDVDAGHPRLTGLPRRGAIGLRNLGPFVEFREIRLRELR